MPISLKHLNIAPTEIFYAPLTTRLTPLLAFFDKNGALLALDFAPQIKATLAERQKQWPQSVFTSKAAPKALQTALNNFLAGKAWSYPLTVLGTDFQFAVWQQLAKLKPGHITSYAAIAKAIGRPKAFRAVGSAVGQNPICLLLPCHRVLASNGGLGGFSGGIALKKKILSHEGVLKGEIKKAA